MWSRSRAEQHRPFSASSKSLIRKKARASPSSRRSRGSPATPARCASAWRIPARRRSKANLELLAGSFYRSENPPLHVSIPAKSQREFSFPMEIPLQTTPNQPVDISATLREQDSATTWTSHSQVIVHRPFDFTVGPTLTFPVREDVQLPIVHPTLASLELPGEAVFQVSVKNWQGSRRGGDGGSDRQPT